jgi:alkylation response protein AidB-like acyl-CoA dehydrogenase
MDLEPNEQQLQLRASARALLADHLDRTVLRSFVDDGAVGAPSAPWWRLGAQAGWTSLLLPEPFGSGAGVADVTIVCEELGRAMFPGPIIAATAVGLALCRSAADEPAAEYAELIAGVADGSSIIAWCPLESGGSSEMRPVRVSDDGQAISGTARFVQDADAASQFLAAAHDGSGTSHVLVDAAAAGVTVRRHVGLDLTRQLFAVTFDATPVSSVVGVRAEAAALAAHLDQVAAVLLCADAVGGCAELVERTVRYAGERIAFGRPIASYQAVKHKCADMLVWTESARVATYYAALAIDELPYEQAARAVSVAKAYAGEAYCRVAGESLQVHGGIGFAWEHDCHLFMRRARTDEMLFGTPRSHRDVLAG